MWVKFVTVVSVTVEERCCVSELEMKKDGARYGPPAKYIQEIPPNFTSELSIG